MDPNETYLVYCKCCKQAFLCHRDACPKSNDTTIILPMSYISDALDIVSEFGKPVIVKQRLAEDLLEGGLADNMSDAEFDPRQLAAGTKLEMEHTNNPRIAKEIAKDNLSKDPHYYSKEMEEQEQAKQQQQQRRR